MQTSTLAGGDKGAASFGYRPDIDGLRAIAVLSVFAFHLDKRWLPGGFVGVDVFFVISGYLITGLVYTEILAGKFSFRNFYRRRINRILPALFAVVFVNLLIGVFLLAPADLVRLAKSALYASLGLSNVFFWREYGNYFSSGVEEAPLLHTWSLGVEEQFYVLWPVLLLLLSRLSPRILCALMAAGLLLALGVSEMGVRNAASASYYLLPTRFFELLIGGALAMLVRRSGFSLGRTASLVVGLVGLLLMFAGFLLLDDASAFPGLNALYPCLGAALVIASGCNADSPVAKWLGRRPFVFFGLISYSLYLWHWPVIAYFHYADIPIGAVEAAGIFLCATVLSWGSWRFVETPFRRHGADFGFAKLILRRYIVPGTAVAAAAMLVIGSHGLPARFSPEVSKYEAIISSAPDMLRSDCHSPTLYYQRKPNPKCLLGDASRPVDGILIGDSYANHFTGMIDVLARRDRVAIMDYTMDGCLPIKGLEIGKQASYAEKCRMRNDFSYDLIRSKRYKYVVLAGSWPTKGTPEFMEEIRLGLERSIGEVVASGAKPIIILNNPRITNANKCPVRRLLFQRSESCDTTWTRNEANRDMFARLASKFPQAAFIDPSQAICDDKTCRPQIGQVPLYRDEGHLNDVGSRLIGQILLDKGVRLRAVSEQRP